MEVAINRRLRELREEQMKARASNPVAGGEGYQIGIPPIR